MNAETAKIELEYLNSQHPNPWTAGAWYPATTRNGKECQIKRTTAVKTGISYLHIRYRSTIAIKTAAGQVTDRFEGWINFRANLRTYELKEI